MKVGKDASDALKNAGKSLLGATKQEISRFSSKERTYMPGSKTTPGRSGARVGAPVRIAFR